MAQLPFTSTSVPFMPSPPTPQTQAVTFEELMSLHDAAQQAQAKYQAALARLAEPRPQLASAPTWDAPPSSSSLPTAAGDAAARASGLTSESSQLTTADVSTNVAEFSPNLPYFDMVGLSGLVDPPPLDLDLSPEHQHQLACTASSPWSSTFVAPLVQGPATMAPPSTASSLSDSFSYSSFGTSPASSLSTSPHALFMSPFEPASLEAALDDVRRPSSFSEFVNYDSSCIDWSLPESGSYIQPSSLPAAPPLVPTPGPSSLPSFDAASFGKVARERSLSKSEVRYSPINRPFTSPSVSPTLSATAGSDIPISNLSLTSPLVRAGSGRRATVSRRLSKSSSTGMDDIKPLTTVSRKGSQKGARGTTEFAYSDKVFPKNDEHIFVVFAQTKENAPEVSERNVTQIHLINPPADSVLSQVIASGEKYTRRHFNRDTGDYLFGDESGATYQVSYSGFTVKIHPFSTVGKPSSSVFTYVHFPPGTMVTSEIHSIGSIGWWRLQGCEAPVRHEGFPGEGVWTARYDAEPNKRRPARILDHMSSCKHRKAEGDQNPLGKLARAVLATLPSGSLASVSHV